MFKPELRMKWDSSAKNITKKEGGDGNYVVHTHIQSPVFFISERETIDKRVEFYYNDIFYCLSTSVSDDYIPANPSVIRCRTFLNLFMVAQDEKFYYTMSFNQVDPKVNLILYIFR